MGLRYIKELRWAKMRKWWGTSTVMEFLDINLTKYSSLMLHAIHSPFTGGFCKRKPYSTLVLIILTKNSAKQENLSLFMSSIVERKKERRKPDKNSSLRRLEFMPIKND
jgi:hypothetical protein